METTEPQVKDEMELGTICVLPGPRRSRRLVVMARRTIDGWEIMPSLLSVDALDLRPTDIRANFDEAYLEDPDRMLRLSDRDEVGAFRGGVYEEFGFAVEARRVPGGWLVNNATKKAP